MNIVNIIIRLVINSLVVIFYQNQTNKHIKDRFSLPLIYCNFLFSSYQETNQKKNQHKKPLVNTTNYKQSLLLPFFHLKIVTKKT